MARILVDTSAVFALLDRSDRHHPAARQILLKLKKEQHEVFLTNFLVAECYSLLLVKLGRALAREWLAGLRWPIERVSESDESQAREIVLSYQDKDFSYTDATSFAIMERLGISTVFAFDRHFEQYGFPPIRVDGT